MDVDIIQKWWNIFQSILGSLGSDVSLKPEALTETLGEILGYLDYARDITMKILHFINIAYRFFEFLKNWVSGGSERPLNY